MRRSSAAASVERAAELTISLGMRIAQLAIIAMMLLITLDVLARNVGGFSLLISDEVSGYLLVTMSFFGIAYSLRSGSLLRIDFILMALPPRLRALLSVVFDVFALIVCLLLLRSLIRFNWSTWERGMVAPTLIETPLWIPQLAMPVGCAILIIAFLLELRDNVRRLLGRAPPVAPAINPELEILS
jgi:TRAP-type C4-dicarboxylate transport system permease small subunit